MKDLTKTLGFVVVAVVVVLLAALTTPGGQEPEVFNDEGTAFFLDFTDPSQAMSLELIEFEAETAQLKIFKVEQKDGAWSIPS